MTEQTVYRHVRALRDHLTPLPGLTRPEISDGTLVMTMRPRPGTNSRRNGSSSNWTRSYRMIFWPSSPPTPTTRPSASSASRTRYWD
ncbi:hypothetical protein LVX13_35785 [Streptomyces albulus]|uniref:hypothetical protein n=1 Tax=Streptomyces noursei TaxID=1971 RepID=UPI001F3D1BCE|nr:hypothetical protein [Streptomyces noursei]MCE4948422.1 hypothetical protein [Streptomyces noursei]